MTQAPQTAKTVEERYTAALAAVTEGVKLVCECNTEANRTGELSTKQLRVELNIALLQMRAVTELLIDKIFVKGQYKDKLTELLESEALRYEETLKGMFGDEFKLIK